MRKSGVERRITPPIMLAIMVPMLLFTLLAMQLIRDETIDSASNNLANTSKSYGMALLDRLQRQATLSGLNVENGRPRLSVAGEKIVLSQEGSSRVVEIYLSDLAPDVLDIENAYRCISLSDTPCMEAPESALQAQWLLRLVSQFETSDKILVMTVQERDVALEGIGLITKIFPLIMALVACLVGYAIVVYLRTSFQPVALLHAAVGRIRRGNYSQRVEIDTDDEFAALASALNSMSSQIGSDITFREAISKTDNGILNDAQLDRILLDICSYCVNHGGTAKAVIAFPGEDGACRYMGFDGQAPIHGELENESLAQAPMMVGFNDTLPLLRDGETWGWLCLACNEATNVERLDELASKASVAVTKDFHVKTLHQRANYDHLTGLYNRVSFVRELERVIHESQRASTVGGLIFLDLDQFKTINDTEGHSVGDELLCVVAERLTDYFRQIDAVARFGGDEFAIALTDIGDRYNMLELLQRLTETVMQPIRIGRFDHTVNCSIGVCLIPQDGEDAETLLKNADVAMYKAKAIQGTSYIFFNTAQHEEMQRRIVLERRLRKAINSDQLDVFLQPKMALRDGDIGACEALVRWQDDELGFVSPAEFVAVAERAGMIGDLTERVVAKVGAYLRSDVRLHSVAVNLSPIQLASANFAERFLDCLDGMKIDYQRIAVEITESVFVSDPLAAKEKLMVLKDRGIKISLDDFGTGYSSLNLLTQLPIDALKLDKSFVDRIPHELDATMVLTKIVEMARGLGMDVIAEGVEIEEQLLALESMGVTHIQGYLIAKPQPLDDYQRLLSDWDAGGHSVSSDN